MASAVGVKVEEHFHTADQQRETAKLGMWVFLLTELLLFSGLFVSALVLRVMHPDSVTAVALHLKFWIGATNTAVLIVSSFCMSAAIEAVPAGTAAPDGLLHAWDRRVLGVAVPDAEGVRVLPGLCRAHDAVPAIPAI